MNVFVLDRDPEKAARYMQDLHIGKMLVESCQLLCLCHPSKPSWLRGLPPMMAALLNYTPYSATHQSHPCALWVKEHPSHYHWLLRHALALGNEYPYRFDKQHGSLPIARWLSLNVPAEFADVGTEPERFAQAMPERYQDADPVRAYRAYYAAEKLVLKGQPASWTRRSRPTWFPAATQC